MKSGSTRPWLPKPKASAVRTQLLLRRAKFARGKGIVAAAGAEGAVVERAPEATESIKRFKPEFRRRVPRCRRKRAPHLRTRARLHPQRPAARRAATDAADAAGADAVGAEAGNLHSGFRKSMR